MKNILISLILIFLTPLQGFPFKALFKNGNVGDYSIYQNGKSVTILNIHSKQLPFITLEEITLPKKIYENIKGIDLNPWMLKGAPGNTSWTLMEINIKTLEVTSTYCFSRNAHLCLKKEDTVIASLLNLDVKKTPKADLLRVGPHNHSKRDTRPFWMPLMYMYGKRVTPKKMEVYGGVWDKDTSALSGREIDLYLFNDFPFPFWIQIHGSLGSKKMVSLDSGKNLHSPIIDIPKMAPTFLSGLEKWNNDDSKFSFLLRGDRIITNYTVHLLEVSKTSPTLIPIEASFQSIETNVLKFDMLREILDKKLTAGKRYRLYLSYEDQNEIKSILSKDIIHWK